jgi:AraC-like DNA-binding protein
MHFRPKIMSARPSEPFQGTDVLSDLLQTMHLTTVVQGVFELRAPWSLELKSALLVVASGSAAIVEGKVAREVHAGELLLRIRGAPVAVRDSVNSKAPVSVPPEPPALRVRTLSLGGSGAATTLIAAGLHFTFPRASSLLERLPPLIRFSAAAPDAPRGLRAALELFVAEASTAGDGSSAILGRLADVLVIQALRASAHRGCPKGDLRALADPQLSQALSLMHGALDRDWTVASLGREVGLSRSSFAARFTAQVGQPPLEYLARWRMTCAARMLTESSHPLSQIASAVGYTSEAAFSKAFARVMQQPPGAFRRAARARPPARTTDTGLERPV